MRLHHWLKIATGKKLFLVIPYLDCTLKQKKIYPMWFHWVSYNLSVQHTFIAISNIWHIMYTDVKKRRSTGACKALVGKPSKRFEY